MPYLLILLSLLSLHCAEPVAEEIKRDQLVPNQSATLDAAFQQTLHDLNYQSRQVTFKIANDVLDESIKVLRYGSQMAIPHTLSLPNQTVTLTLPLGYSPIIIEAYSPDEELLSAVIDAYVDSDKGNDFGSIELSSLGAIRGTITGDQLELITFYLESNRSKVYQMKEDGEIYIPTLVSGNHQIVFQFGTDIAKVPIEVASGEIADLGHFHLSQLHWEQTEETYHRYRLAFQSTTKDVSQVALNKLQISSKDYWLEGKFFHSHGFLGNYDVTVISSGALADSKAWQILQAFQQENVWTTAAGSFQDGEYTGDHPPFIELAFSRALHVDKIRVLSNSGPLTIGIYASHDGISWHLMGTAEGVENNFINLD